MTSLIPSPVLQFCDGDGKPFSGGRIAVYEPGTFNPLSTYVEPTGVVPNPNPIILDADGRCVMYGRGRLRLILYDALGNLIWDGETEAYLGDSVISAVMLPVVGAATLAEARRLMGIDDAIQLAVDNISLMPGPPGIQGPTGPVGPQGNPGPQGDTSDSNNHLERGNPGYLLMNDTGFMLAFGNDTTDGSGVKTISYAKPFSGVMSVTAVTVDNPINLVLRVINMNNNTFTVGIEDTDNTHGWICKFNWQAVGWA